MTLDAQAISRAASHALRHAPEVYGLFLDNEGWVTIDDLLQGLRKKGAEWASVDHVGLRMMIQTSNKQRFEISDDRIRAMYGHSVSREIQHTVATPPTTLFHGTSPAAWEKIQVEGLQPMQRQKVHLAADIATAVLVGKRKANPPLILAVDTRTALRSGSQFWLGNESIWLADFVSAEHITAISTTTSASSG